MMGLRRQAVDQNDRLDGTPATFARLLKKYSELKFKRCMFIRANKLDETAQCPFCDATGGEWLWYASWDCMDPETGEVHEQEMTSYVHGSHFETSVGKDEEDVQRGDAG